ncbi:MAG: hypothetical protein LBP23_09875 [Treponema sp.]|nr:hypothetical protein [Treponema sp.]
MKRRTCFLLIAAVTLIAIMGGCDDGGGLPGPPIAFTGSWVDPTWTGGDVNSRFNIFIHDPGQKIPGAVMNILTSGAITSDLLYPVPRVFTVNPDWTFTYTGGFGQNPISAGVTLYPRIVVKGTISYAEGQFYTITPTAATIDLTEIAALPGVGANISLPPETVASFEEYAKIYYDDAGKLVIDDMPQTVVNAKGILRGIWTKQ